MAVLESATAFFAHKNNTCSNFRRDVIKTHYPTSRVILEPSTALLAPTHNTYTTFRCEVTKTYQPPLLRQGLCSNQLWHCWHSHTTPTLPSTSRFVVKPSTVFLVLTYNTDTTLGRDITKTYYSPLFRQGLCSKNLALTHNTYTTLVVTLHKLVTHYYYAKDCALTSYGPTGTHTQHLPHTIP